jgi:hypothetical protein
MTETTEQKVRLVTAAALFCYKYYAQNFAKQRCRNYTPWAQ